MPARNAEQKHSRLESCQNTQIQIPMPTGQTVKRKQMFRLTVIETKTDSQRQNNIYSRSGRIVKKVKITYRGNLVVSRQIDKTFAVFER